MSKKTGRKITTISKNTLQGLMNYHWPGNIRNLEHVIERGILLADDDVIRQIYLSGNKENMLKKTIDT